MVVGRDPGQQEYLVVDEARGQRVTHQLDAYIDSKRLQGTRLAAMILHEGAGINAYGGERDIRKPIMMRAAAVYLRQY